MDKLIQHHANLDLQEKVAVHVSRHAIPQPIPLNLTLIRTLALALALVWVWGCVGVCG